MDPEKDPSADHLIRHGGHTGALIEAKNWLKLTNGWAATAALSKDGRQQIIQYHLPGDWLAPSSTLLPDCQYIALTPVDYRSSNGPEEPKEATHTDRLRSLVLHFQVIRLGALSSYQRVAHLFLELHARSSAAGFSEAMWFPMPLTQKALAGSLGLSVVHLNRMIQKLRHDRMLDVEHGRAEILNQDGLIAITKFRWPDDMADTIRPARTEPESASFGETLNTIVPH